MSKPNIKSPVGKAYAFFQQDRDDSISGLLPWIREYTRTLSELTLDLVMDIDKLNTENDSALADIVEQAKQEQMNHVLKATLLGNGNRKVAEYLGDIMNGVCAELYPGAETSPVGIVYKRGEQYVFRRK